MNRRQTGNRWAAGTAALAFALGGLQAGAAVAQEKPAAAPGRPAEQAQPTGAQDKSVGVPGKPAGAQDKPAESVDATRAMLEKWVETRRVISKEKHDWDLGQEMLRERIELVKQETRALHLKLADAEKSITEADAKKVELAAEQQRLAATATALTATVQELERQTLALVRRLPDPLRERVQPLSQRIPAGDEPTRLTVGTRYMNVIGVLNDVNKWNREITITSEVRKLADGSSAEVVVLYLGLGQAYYVTNNGAAAGVGRPGPDGWEWTPANDSAPQVKKAIAMLKNEQVAGFVQLPIRVGQQGR
jgi:hypothetical protein